LTLDVLIVSGIWPPDVGGPASHAPEVASYLLGRGDRPRVLTTADAPPAPEAYPVAWVSRRRPPGVRHAEVAARIAAAARGADVVYATSMAGRAGAGSAAARRPLVLKVVADPAFERARRSGLFAGTLQEFQRDRSARTLPFRAVRDAVVRRAAHVVCPSGYLAELVVGWGVASDQVTVLPNPAPLADDLPPRDELRARWQLDGPTLVFAGRLTAQKTLEVAIEAARRAGVPLLVVGDGPERGRLEALGGARFLGPLPRASVLELLRAADASVLSSAWENFPHAVVESLAVGTPVVATDVGGVAEVVRDGENGALVPIGDVAAFAAGIERVLGDPELRAAAAPSVERYAPERIYGRLRELLAGAAGR
jgi:glycosyltransferase involved in cell wall biosynthesis